MTLAIVSPPFDGEAASHRSELIPIGRLLRGTTIACMHARGRADAI
jgi:hypothetical protein